MKYFTVTENTTPADLKRRYRQLCKRYHPDKGGSDDTQTEINAEYEQALARLADIASQAGDRESSRMITRLMQQHIYNMYTDMKTPIIKKYVPAEFQEFQGLAFEVAKLIEKRWG